MTDFLQQILNGISLGSTYALLALGLAIVFSIVGLVNFAHGELITVCGYVMLAGLSLGLPWWAYALLGVLGTILAAVAMERLAFRPVRSASPLTMMLTSLGVSIGIAAAFETFVSPRVKAVPTPEWVSAAVHVGALRVQAEHILTIGVTAVAILLLLLLLKKTVIGKAMRAASEDFNAVRLMGVKANAIVVTCNRHLRSSRWPRSGAHPRSPRRGQPAHGHVPRYQRLRRQRHRRPRQSVGSRRRRLRAGVRGSGSPRLAPRG